MELTQIADLAKQGGRLASDKQWVLADALAELTESQIATVAIQASRNESTLLQYARAAERWPSTDRVDGVSFSAHRVALSWHDPRQLLIDLKHKHGSPTVQQVRQAMGLEGHPAIELIERGIKKLDRKVSAQVLGETLTKIADFLQELDPNEVEAFDSDLDRAAAKEVDEYLDKEAEEASENHEPKMIEVAGHDRWTPPLRTSDIAGM